MRVPLAWCNLVHNKLRTLVASSGVAFAVILVFMQLGFLGAVETTAMLIYEALDFDLVVRSPMYLHLAEPRNFPRNRLHMAEACPGVQQAIPFHCEISQWQNPYTRRIRGILVLGVAPESPAFTIPEIREKVRLLTVPEYVLIDRKCRSEFGPSDGEQFSDKDIGVMAEVGRQRVRIAGHYSLGAGLASDGSLIASEVGFQRLLPGRSHDDVSLGLVKLVPGVDPQTAAECLRKRLPADVEVLTRAEVVEFERNRWINETSIGLIFSLGVFVAVVVGTAIAYQVLSTDVTKHLPEFATLKAMGYTPGYLSAVVLKQALALAVLGFIPGAILSEVLYQITTATVNIPIEMTQLNFTMVLGLTVGMCAISGLAALRKALLADPADLF